MARLIQLIESHWDALTDRVIRRIRQDQRLHQIGSLPESDLREKARNILEHLGKWLSLRDEAEVAGTFERIGARRHAERVPLAEVVLSYVLIKDSVLDYVRSQGFALNAMEIWAEEELAHDLGRFFDSLIYHLVVGYTEAMQPARTKTA